MQSERKRETARQHTLRNVCRCGTALVVAAAFAVGTPIAFAAEAKVKTGRSTPGTKKKPARRNPVFAPIQDDPKLPRVLLIGDSISIGYTLPTRKLLKGKANVHRIPTNGGPTTRGLENLKKWLGTGKWDVIHFNFGLHDLKRMEDGKHQVPIDAYEKNLRSLVKQLKATGARLIWASTTPVPKGAANRQPGDEVRYNAVAAKIMKQNGIATNDLYGFALPRLDKIQRPANVHFWPKGSAALAERVAAAIQAARAQPASQPRNVRPRPAAAGGPG